MGVVVTDDVIQNAAKNSILPLEGALVVRLKKPVPCVFISFGLGGVALPDMCLCTVGDSWNCVTKEEGFALSALILALDFEQKLGLRMQWYLIDMKDADARVLKSPTDMELTKLFKTPSAMKGDDPTKYKLVARIARRRTTAGAGVLDGHEDDSDRDPIMAYLDDMIEKEERSEKARKKRLGDFPDTPTGWKMARLMAKQKTTPTTEEVEPKDRRPKKRPRTLYPPKSARKRKRISYGAEPGDTPRPVPAACETFLQSLFEGSSADEKGEEKEKAATTRVPTALEMTETESLTPQQRPPHTTQAAPQSARLDCEQEDLHTEEEVPFQSDDGEGDCEEGIDYEDD